MMKVYTLNSKGDHTKVLFVVDSTNIDDVTIDYVFPRDPNRNYTHTQSLDDARRVWKYFMVDLGYTRELI